MLLNDFHKNASFHPDMRNYWNTTFTFGKETKDNFINRKVQCRPHIHSLILMSAFRLWRVAGAAAHGGSEIRQDQQHAISDSSAVSTPRRDQARSEM